MIKFEELNLTWLDEPIMKLIKFDKGSGGLVRLFLVHKYFKVFKSFQILQRNYCHFWVVADLEKAASGASGACGHFVGNHTILSTL